MRTKINGVRFPGDYPTPRPRRSPLRYQIQCHPAYRVLGGSLALSAEPAAAWCNYYGDCYYNDGGAAIGGAMFGLALGTMIGAAAAQQQQTQQQVPVCYAPNGNPYFARAWHGRWRC
jgi:hypothetical protein